MTERKPTPSPVGEPKKCPECDGRGWVDHRCLTEDHTHKCPYCDGKGADIMERDCEACHGSGMIEVRKEDKNPCPLCGGAGVYPVPEFMTAGDYAYNPSRRK
jgi:hypothetical protein